MKPPAFVECSVCGREFGSKSIPIHERQCLQKLRRTEITQENHSGSSLRGNRRKKRSGPTTSSMTTGQGQDEAKSPLSLPRIQTDELPKVSTDSQRRKGARPTTATLPRPKFLNLEHIRYDMSLTRIDYKTSNLRIMDEKPGDELVLPVVSPSVKGKGPAGKINTTDTPPRSITKLPQSTLATISSIFGAPLKKDDTGSLPRHSEGGLSHPLPLLPPSSHPAHECVQSPKPSTLSTPLYHTIFPTITNDRSPAEHESDALLTSPQPLSSGILPNNRGQDERREPAKPGRLRYPGQRPESGKNGSVDQDLPPANTEVVVLKDVNSSLEFSSSASETILHVQDKRMRKVSNAVPDEIFGTVGSTVSAKLKSEERPSSESSSSSESTSSDSDSEETDSSASVGSNPGNSKLLRTRSAPVFSQQAIEELPIYSPPRPPSNETVTSVSFASPLYTTILEPSPQHPVQNDPAGLNQKSGAKPILKNGAGSDIESSLNMTPPFFRPDRRNATFTGSDSDDETELSCRYGFLRHTSTVSLLKRKERRKWGYKQRARESGVGRNDDEIVDELTNLLHKELAKQKRRRSRFQQPEGKLEQRVSDWLSASQPQGHEDPVTVWEGVGGSGNLNRVRPATSPAVLNQSDIDEYGYDTDISQFSSSSTGHENKGRKKRTISGLVSAVFRVKELHKTRTYKFRDRMRVEGPEIESDLENTVYLRPVRKRKVKTAPHDMTSLKPKGFGLPLTSPKLNTQTLKALGKIEENTRVSREQKRPGTSPAVLDSWAEAVRQAMGSDSPWGSEPRKIVVRPFTFPGVRRKEPERVPRGCQSPNVIQRPAMSSDLRPSPYSPLAWCPYLKFPSSSIPKAPTKPKNGQLKRPPTLKPELKMKDAVPEGKKKSSPKKTSHQACQVPETQTKCVQSSPPVGRKVKSTQKSASPTLPPASPYSPTKSILKQIPKAKRIQLGLSEDPPSKKLKKSSLPKPKPIGVGMDRKSGKKTLIDRLREPSVKFQVPVPNKNSSKYRTTHQVYQFETTSKFGKPYQAEDFDPDPDHSSQPDLQSVFKPTALLSSSTEDTNTMDGESAEADSRARSRPVHKVVDAREQQRRNDILSWERMAEVEDRNNSARDREMERSREDSGTQPAATERRQPLFRSTYKLLVPNMPENDRLLDLNIIVRRRDEENNYPPLDEAIREYSTKMMYLIVDEVRLTQRSPNPYIDSQQVDRKVEYDKGEIPLKITTSSLSSIESMDSEEGKKHLLTCYICGEDFLSNAFLDHELTCKEVRLRHVTTDTETQTPRRPELSWTASDMVPTSFLSRNEFLDPAHQESLPKKPHGTITIGAWNRFAKDCTKNKRVHCPFCDASFVPTEEKIAEHKAACTPLPRVCPPDVKPMQDHLGNSVALPLNNFLTLKYESATSHRDVESATAEQMRKRFNKNRNKRKENGAAEEEEPSSTPTDPSNVPIVVFKEKSRLTIG